MESGKLHTLEKTWRCLHVYCNRRTPLPLAPHGHNCHLRGTSARRRWRNPECVQCLTMYNNNNNNNKGFLKRLTNIFIQPASAGPRLSARCLSNLGQPVSSCITEATTVLDGIFSVINTQSCRKNFKYKSTQTALLLDTLHHQHIH